MYAFNSPRKSVVWSLPYLALMQFAFGQSSKLDSIGRQIKATPNDTVLVNLYYLYGEELANKYPDSALWYYNVAKKRSMALKYDRGKAAYASHAIEILNTQGKFKEALALCKEALTIYETIGSKRDIAVALINIGSEWHYLSDFHLATDNYLMALKIAEELEDIRLQRIINNNLASIFINLKEFEKGKTYAIRALELAHSLKNDYAISSSMFNIATAELYLKDYGNALKHYSQIVQIGEKIDDYILILDGLLGTADVYNAEHNYGKALNYYSKIIALTKEKDAPEYEMYAYMGLSDLYKNTGQDEQSVASILSGISLAEKLGTKYELKDLYLKASEMAEKARRYRDALEYRKKYEILNDSVVGEKSKLNINLLEAKFESEKKEAMISNLVNNKKIQELSISQKNSLNYLLFGVIMVILLTSYISYRNYRHKQKLQTNRINELETEKQLAATAAVLKGEEQERTRLAKDLHDGLGGMLSGIKYSFESIKGNMIMTNDNQQVFERSMDMLDSSIKEMRRVAHNMMPESLLKFGLDTALKDFCNHINKTGAVQINYLSFGLANTSINQTVAITIYRIVQELINNTLKHAKAETVIVQITKTEHQLTITVEDDGEGFDTLILKKSQGMGWTNILHRVEFLKGNLNVDSEYSKGTSVHIEFNV
ncbi:sensor histidine kinase [Arenibacter algicola]|uniref:tetratricopeptide repeat-containing sensor histidine kinase n=1 Tax=Arenibacter algicola TaxID=616991 RepID=UPI001C072827|nr:sensor histidine kinase [Arenibacter algicola]MBU2904685.1 sensor histidine kinase [Arenibacter algicola]